MLKKCALFAILLATVVMQAQVFHIQAGGSTLLDAEGGSIGFTAPNYDGTIGLGLHDGRFEFGAQARYKRGDYTFLGGDDAVPFNVPTDLFNTSHYFFARGAGVSYASPQQSFHVFGGTTSSWLGTGFFNSATSDDPLGMLFYQRRFSKTLEFFSRDVISNRQTALQAVEWKPSKYITASLTGGIGSNESYFASGLQAQSHSFGVKANYVATGAMFRRVEVSAPLVSEVNKENIEITYKPGARFSVTAGHFDILQPIVTRGPMQEASVNELAGNVHAGKYFFGASLFQSKLVQLSTTGENFYLGRRFGQRLEVNTNYFVSESRNERASTILSGTIRENISRRFSLLQLISRSNGQTTAAFGGSLTTNRLNLGVDYQNAYLPFRPDRPFQQALAFNAALRVLGPAQFTASSSLAPDGHIRYAFGMSTYIYHLQGANSIGPPPAARRAMFSKYLVQGVVKDERGILVEGVALHVGKQLAYTDSSGHFLIRFSKPGVFPLNVALAEFVTDEAYDLVSAPSEVRAEPEESAKLVQVLIRRVPSPVASLNGQ